MGRVGRIALVAALGGLLLSLALLHAVRPSAPGASAAPISAADAPSAAPKVPAHCRAITIPDPECDAAWDAKRRAFFGAKDKQP